MEVIDRQTEGYARYDLPIRRFGLRVNDERDA